MSEYEKKLMTIKDNFSDEFYHKVLESSTDIIKLKFSKGERLDVKDSKV